MREAGGGEKTDAANTRTHTAAARRQHIQIATMSQGSEKKEEAEDAASGALNPRRVQSAPMPREDDRMLPSHADAAAVVSKGEK